MMARIGICLLVISLLLTGCGDTNVTNSEAQSYSISGDVKGCVEDLSNIPVEGASVSIGNVTGTTGADGCYSLNITITTMNSSDTAATNFAVQDVIVKHERFDDTLKSFTPTENVVAGVIWDFGTYALTDDGLSPQDDGIVDVLYANNMLKEGIDGSATAFEIKMSEYIDLADNINTNIILELKDADQNTSTMDVTPTVTFNAVDNILVINTSPAIPEGYYVTFRIPAEDIMDVNGNDVITGVDATVAPFGLSLTDYLSFNVRVFTEGDLNAETVTVYTQMDEDSGLATDEEYAADLTALETSNASFKNLVKYDLNDVNAKQISIFNNGGAITATRMQNLGDAYVTDPTAPTITVINDVLRIKFTPTNADNYLIKAYDDANNSVAITLVDESINATSNVVGGNIEVDTIVDLSVDVELAFRGVNATNSTTIAIVPMSAAGTRGTASTFIVKDNVAPTTSLQYSYDATDEDTSSTVNVTGGVVTSVLYGGSGELSNHEDITTTINTLYTVGTPYLDMTNALLFDQNATTVGTNSLASPYTANDYTVWIGSAERSIGIGFTEQIDINGTATLTKSDASDASSLITATINTVDNLPVTNNNAPGNEEHIAIVTVDNIFTLVNEHNGSVVDLTSITTDLAGNAASSAKVILVDKVAPYIVSSSIDSTDMANSTITFSENVVAGTISIAGTPCIINTADITLNEVSLATCAAPVAGTQSIDFSLMSDANGNTNLTHIYNATVN